MSSRPGHSRNSVAFSSEYGVPRRHSSTNSAEKRTREPPAGPSPEHWFWKDDLRDKTLRGLEGRHLAGHATGGVPYGFRTVADLDGNGRELGRRIEIHEERAAIVRGIFTSYVSGGSLSGIARKLNEDTDWRDSDAPRRRSAG